MEKVLLIGTGNVGSHILEFIARDENKLEWVIGDIDENRARLKCNNASIGAAHHGKDPVFHIKKVDLLNIDKTADLIQKRNQLPLSIALYYTLGISFANFLIKYMKR